MNEPNILIKEALEATVRGINSGLTPTDALIKAAAEYDLNPHYIQRVGEVTNVSLHYNHFKKASDKASDFPIVDIPQVIKTAFNQEEKTASQSKSEWFPTAELNDTIPDYNKYINDGVYKRAYLQIVETGKGAENTKYATSLKGMIEKSAHYIQNLKKSVDNAKTEKVGADFKLDNNFANLVNHFSKSAHARTPWHEIESQVYAKKGEDAVPYLDLVYKSAGLKEERGARSASYYNFSECPEVSMFDKLLKSAEVHLQADENLKTAEHNLEFEKSYHDEIFRKETPIKKNAAEVAPAEKGPDGPKEKSAEENEAELDEASQKVAFNLLEILGKRFSDSLSSKEQSGGSNPLANTASDNVQRKMVLQELIMTDPVLSKEQPQKVVSAYQQILRVAPEISKEKEVMRSLLREMMATQALHPHTSNQLTEANINLMRQKVMQHNPTQGK